MREIEFRGKVWNCIKNEWIWKYGPDMFGFIGSLPETIGQWTGLLDKGFHRVYEGDVVDVVPILGIHFRGVVKFNSHTSAFDVFREEQGDSACLKDDFSIEVRGNVFDNPEFKKYKEVYFRED